MTFSPAFTHTLGRVKVRFTFGFRDLDLSEVAYNVLEGQLRGGSGKTRMAILDDCKSRSEVGEQHETDECGSV